MKEDKKEQDRRHIILEKPLPEILDDIERSIEVSEAAAAEARKAAEEARLAGEKAAEEVMRRIRKVFMKMSHDITEELKESDKKV